MQQSHLVPDFVPQVQSHAAPSSQQLPLPPHTLPHHTLPPPIEKTTNMTVTVSHANNNKSQPKEVKTNKPGPKRTRNKTACPELWKRNKQKRLKTAGHEYTNYKGCVVAAKAPRPCDCSKCRFKCSIRISEEVRASICKAYWGLSDYNRQKDFLLSRMKVGEVERRRVQEADRRRKLREQVISYFLDTAGDRVRVCKKFFTKTLCIGHAPIDTAFRQRSDQGTFLGEDLRGKQHNNKTDPASTAVVRAHIESFPKIESHYTGSKDTGRQFLDQSLNISKMYRLYRESFDPKEGIQPVKEGFYRKIFVTEYNLAFFSPNQD